MISLTVWLRFGASSGGDVQQFQESFVRGMAWSSLAFGSSLASPLGATGPEVASYSVEEGAGGWVDANRSDAFLSGDLRASVAFFP